MIQIEATYAATDGSAPETIRIEWGDGENPTVGGLVVLVDALAKVAQRWDVREVTDGDD